MPTILVVDDSLSVRKVAERQLTEAGLEVALVSNGEEALNWLTNRRPDLVIADVIMPDKSGFEVCAFVRSNAALADTPVILVSGFVDEEVTRQAEACRADGIIKKPFQGAILRERVLELLSGRKAHSPQAPARAPAAPGEDLGRAARDSTTSAIHVLEKRLAEQEKALGQASTLVQDLADRLAEAEKQTADLQKRLAELEPAAASAEKLQQLLGEFIRQAEQTLGRHGS
ncbi:MAG TPA: response regulator [Nitrospirales bacterium]|jgi:CheY-like chemotaxis protein|nr:response regulator [Nitrospirales bacterium]